MKTLLFALLASVSLSSAGGDFRADLARVHSLLAADASFTADERARATRRLSDLEQRAGTLDTAAFQLAVAGIFAEARNGHTMLVAGLWPSQFPRIAVRMQVFADGIHIIAADDQSLIGLRLLSIDDQPATVLREKFADYWGAVAGKRDDWLGYWLESPALLHAAGLAKRADQLQLKLADESGVIRTLTLTATLQPPVDGRYAFFSRARLVKYFPLNQLSHENAQAPTPLYLAEPDRTFRYVVLPELDAFYLQLRYNHHVGSEKLDIFASEALRALEQADSTHLIVDLRLNSGGDLNLTRDLMQRLPSLLPAHGQIFAISSGRTFSAGIASLGYVKQAAGKRLRIVGEPVGDELEYWAEGSLVSLPDSGAEVLIATERHNYVTGCPESDCHLPIRQHPIRVPTLAPDLSAPLTYDAYRRGIDPAMQVIADVLADIRETSASDTPATKATAAKKPATD